MVHGVKHSEFIMNEGQIYDTMCFLQVYLVYFAMMFRGVDSNVDFFYNARKITYTDI